MSTPLLQALRDYAQSQPVRFHMPGHKGVLVPPFDSVAPLDVTELAETGDLYFEPEDGIIRRSERAMAVLYGAADCCYLTGGATQGIYAMLSAVTRPGDTVCVDRAAHRAVYNALALLDLYPVWLRRETVWPWGIPGAFCDRPAAGSIAVTTAPNYYGVITPLFGHGGITLCDAAHGAHLPFASAAYTPPGNLWTVSAHKTLGALGQTACLLSDGTVDGMMLRERTALFGTASPSFVLLASLDAARDELERGGIAAWERITSFVRMLAGRDERILTERVLPDGYAVDPARLVVCTGDGFGDAARLAREQGVICETADARNIIFMLSPHNTGQDLARLENALGSLPHRERMVEDCAPEELPEAVMSPREAFFAVREQVSLNTADGRVAACVFAAKAPGVPIFAPGERIDKKHLEILTQLCYNGDEPIWVVR